MLTAYFSFSVIYVHTEGAPIHNGMLDCKQQNDLLFVLKVQRNPLLSLFDPPPQDKKVSLLTASNQRRLSYIFFIIAAVILVVSQSHTQSHIYAVTYAVTYAVKHTVTRAVAYMARSQANQRGQGQTVDVRATLLFIERWYFSKTQGNILWGCSNRKVSLQHFNLTNFTDQSMKEITINIEHSTEICDTNAKLNNKHSIKVSF